MTDSFKAAYKTLNTYNETFSDKDLEKQIRKIEDLTNRMRGFIKRNVDEIVDVPETELMVDISPEERENIAMEVNTASEQLLSDISSDTKEDNLFEEYIYDDVI